MQTRSISFAVDDRIYANLEKRAAPMGLRPAEYARRLFEAAYLARAAAERGEAFDDAQLDRQVRQAFLLADCEPAFIAEAVGCTAARAERIVAGWRKYFEDAPAAPALAPPEERRDAPAAGVADRAGSGPKPRDPRSVKAWPEEMVARMQVLWAEGRTLREIGAAVGKTSGNVSVFTSKNRDMFPRRAEA